MARPPMKRKIEELDEVLGDGAAERRDEEKDGRDEQEAAAAEPVARRAGDQGADHAADEDDAHGQALAEGGQVELVLEEAGRAGDDGRVEAEEQAAEGGDDRDRDDVGFLTHGTP